MNDFFQIESISPITENGFQFVLYADSCSGTRDTIEEKGLSKVNRVLQRLSLKPKFICFPGDEIIGLTPNKEKLQKQWHYWQAQEMAWIRDNDIPLYNTTGNHTAYDKNSEEVFRACNAHLPQNGPIGQEGLSYYIVDEDVLLIAVNTLCFDLGGEGHVELEWLDQILAKYAAYPFKFVMGHHPIFPVASKQSPYGLTVEPENGKAFWRLLKNYNVFAYLCSHILTYDVQVHNGILQLLSGGAGRTRKFLHLIQAAMDSEGIRYQVLNGDGEMTQGVIWPPKAPDSKRWISLRKGTNNAPKLPIVSKEDNIFHWWKFSGTALNGDYFNYGKSQTLLSGWNSEDELFTFWIGVIGKERRITVQIRPEPTKSPRYWHGPQLSMDGNFAIDIAMHTGMNAGGILWRLSEYEGWNSFGSTNEWGAELIKWPEKWTIGHNQHDITDLPFDGYDIKASYCSQLLQLRLEDVK